MAAKEDPSKFVKSLVCIPELEYLELLERSKKAVNYTRDPQEKISRDHVFRNIANATKGLDQLRREKKRRREEGEAYSANFRLAAELPQKYLGSI